MSLPQSGLPKTISLQGCSSLVFAKRPDHETIEEEESSRRTSSRNRSASATTLEVDDMQRYLVTALLNSAQQPLPLPSCFLRLPSHDDLQDELCDITSMEIEESFSGAHTPRCEAPDPVTMLAGYRVTKEVTPRSARETTIPKLNLSDLAPFTMTSSGPLSANSSSRSGSTSSRSSLPLTPSSSSLSLSESSLGAFKAGSPPPNPSRYHPCLASPRSAFTPRGNSNTTPRASLPANNTSSRILCNDNT